MTAALYPLTFMRQCGECSLCCEVLGVVELDKPRNVQCIHCEEPRGCGIHGAIGYPRSCGDFDCGWRVEDNRIPLNLRPDKVHAVLHAGTSPRNIVVYVDPDYPLAHTHEPLFAFLRRLAADGWLVDAAIGEAFYRLAGRQWIPLRVVSKSPDVIEVRA